MKATTAYDPQVFDGLDEFKVAKQFIEAGKAKLDDIGGLICHYGEQQNVGIALLHKHFTLHPDEKLVEEFDGEHSYVRAVTGANEQIMPYMWKLSKDEETGEWQWYPLEFIKVTEKTADICKRAEAVAANEALLRDVSQKLLEFGLQERLGVSVLHRDLIPLSEGETLLEITDEQKRVLTFSAIPKTEVDPGDMYETLWHFTPGTKEGVGLCSAHLHCSQHCSC